jgi:hypothetical protein
VSGLSSFRADLVRAGGGLPSPIMMSRVESGGRRLGRGKGGNEMRVRSVPAKTSAKARKEDSVQTS